jgi:hypothetical protein
MVPGAPVEDSLPGRLRFRALNLAKPLTPVAKGSWYPAVPSPSDLGEIAIRSWVWQAPKRVIFLNLLCQNFSDFTLPTQQRVENLPLSSPTISTGCQQILGFRKSAINRLTSFGSILWLQID